MELPFLGSILHFNPSSSVAHHSLQTTSVNELWQTVVESSSGDIFASLRSVSGDLWKLWELVMLGEPILVASQTPNLCSDAVHALVSLISPIRYQGDYRPYFTIHDSDFKVLTHKKQAAAILGVTNPYFFKALAHWPHVLIIDDTSPSATSSSLFKPWKARSTNSLKLFADFKIGLKSSYSCCMGADRTVLKELLNCKTKGQCNAIIQQHFLERTREFLRPVLSYLKYLTPKNLSVFDTPKMDDFNEEYFIKRMELSTSDNSSKFKVFGGSSAKLRLYRKFFQTEQFTYWLEQRQKAAAIYLARCQDKQLQSVDLPSQFEGRSEVRIVDLYLRLKERLAKAQNDPSVSYTARTVLKSNLAAIFAFLPADLKASLSNSLELDLCGDTEAAGT